MRVGIDICIELPHEGCTEMIIIERSSSVFKKLMSIIEPLSKQILSGSVTINCAPRRLIVHCATSNDLMRLHDAIVEW